ncbi:hypothetical protein HDZ31DRAFT_15929, partial [Schizophyllum fasciatum]
MSSAQQAAREVQKILAWARTSDARSPTHFSPPLSPLRAIVAARERLCDLLVDPYSLGPSSWTLDHEPVSKALVALDTLAQSFDSFEYVHENRYVSHTPKLPKDPREAGPFTQCSRILWPWISKWIDVFLPSNPGIDTKNSHLEVLRQVCRLVRCIFQRKHLLQDVIFSTPWMYSAVYECWLNLDRYAPVDPTKGTWISSACAEDLSIAAAYAIGMPTQVSLWPEVTAEFARATVDPIAQQGALKVTKHDIHTLHGLLLRQCFRLLDLGTIPTNTLARSVDIIAFFVRHGLPVTHHARRTVVQAVKLFRRLLHWMSCPGAAHVACAALYSMWTTAADDNASLAWALREGVLSLIIKLDERQDSKTKSATLQLIVRQTTCSRVLRALVKGNGDRLPTFAGAGFARPEEVEAMVLRRWQEMEERRARLKACAFSECASRSEKTWCCPCALVAYCSVKCQRGDWARHREQC